MESEDVLQAEENEVKSAWTFWSLPFALAGDAAQSFRTTVLLSDIDVAAVKNACKHYLTLLMATYVYCFLGAFIFRLLEGWHEVHAKCEIQKARHSLIEDFWNQSAYVDYDEWKSFATDKLKDFEDSVRKAYDEGVTTYSGTKVWSFDGALVYSITLFTTIGYGHIVPSTTAGRLLTMMYAAFGIPLLLMVLADFGKLFTRGIKFSWSFTNRFYNSQSCQHLRNARIFQVITNKNGTSSVTNSRDVIVEYCVDDEFDLPLGAAIGLLVGYLLLGAFMFTRWEHEWSYFEAFYFVFISMSTIGLGDYVPQHPLFMMGTFVYLLFGLALTSMCISVIQEWLTEAFKQASTTFSIRMGLEAVPQGQNRNYSAIDPHTSALKRKNE